MIITGHLNFFNIVECGLYKYNSSTPKGLEIAETLDLIYKWVEGKPLQDTIPWDPSESRTGVPKCYCHDVYKCESTGEYLFVLWKSETDSGGTLLGAPATATTGNGEVIEYTDRYSGKKMIWGRPCYYWIIPSLNTVVSVKTDHSACDSQMLQDWIQKCITNRISHPNKKRETTEAGHTRLSFTDGTEPSDERYAFRFDVKLQSIDTATSELQKLAGSVTHIIRRETIKLDTGSDERSQWIKMFDKIPYLQAKPRTKTRQLEIRAEAKPSATELRNIIEKFSKENRRNHDWDNVGFQTETGTVWVDRYRLKGSVNFQVDEPASLNAVKVHEKLSSKRAELLTALKRHESAAKRERVKLIQQTG